MKKFIKKFIEVLTFVFSKRGAGLMLNRRAAR